MLFLYIIVGSWRTHREFYKLQVRASESPELFILLLYTLLISAHALFSSYCCLHPCTPSCPLHTYQYKLCIVGIVNCTHVHHVVHYTNISTYVLLTVPISYSLLQGLGNNCIGELHQPNSSCFGRRSVTISFGLSNDLPGARTQQTKQQN